LRHRHPTGWGPVGLACPHFRWSILNERLFYAHLYLGLYFDVAGNEKMAREHIVQAAELFKVDSYMGAVARIHAALMRQQSH